MSDLLSRMITRATRPISRVEPILSSRFEPAAALEAPVPAEVHPPPARRAAMERIPPAADREDDVAETESPVIRPESQAPVVEVERIAPREEHSPSPAPLALRPVASDSPLPGPSIVHRQILVQAADLVRVVEIQQQRVEAPAIERTEIRSEVLRTEATVVVPARADDRARRANRRAEPSEKARTEPVEVHVTIGHIEVRAAAPVAPPVRRPSPPRISLEDYLKRRSGGAR